MHVQPLVLRRGQHRIMYTYYKKELYKLCYEQVISPIHGQKRWQKTNEELLPPLYIKGSGRLKKT